MTRVIFVLGSRIIPRVLLPRLYQTIAYGDTTLLFCYMARDFYKRTRLGLGTGKNSSRMSEQVGLRDLPRPLNDATSTILTIICFRPPFLQIDVLINMYTARSLLTQPPSRHLSCHLRSSRSEELGRCSFQCDTLAGQICNPSLGSPRCCYIPGFQAPSLNKLKSLGASKTSAKSQRPCAFVEIASGDQRLKEYPARR